MTIERTIVVGGASRSGTTLTTAIFDAHPEVAMAFEAVPRTFDQDLSVFVDLCSSLIAEFGEEACGVFAPQDEYRKVQQRVNAADKWFGNWVRLCRRSGVGLTGVRDVLNEVQAAGYARIDSDDARLTAARLIATRKGALSGKPAVGVKCGGYMPFADHFPNVYHVVIMRDPRDALASWRRLEWRDRPAQEHARLWCKLFEKYRANVAPDRLVPIRYPEWASGDQDYARSIFAKLGLTAEFDTRTYHETTMVKDIAGVQITQEDLWTSPLKAKVGYYPEHLSAEDIDAVEEVAGPLMTEFGFL